ncbi:MAG: PAS domain S-box protein [Bacteroidetes bacterium]|nr:PAS domain S-box protein [Bacteroidota bacterium]
MISNNLSEAEMHKLIHELQVRQIELEMQNEEQKQTIRAFQESEAKYRIITENVNDMITRHTPEGIYTYLSPSCQSILGYQPHELIGINPYTLFHPDDILAIEKTHSTIVKNQDVKLITYRIKRKDNQYVWLETNNKSIIDTKSGEIKEIICISRDITENKEAEIKLQLSELKYKNLVEYSIIGIYSTNLKGDFLFANNAMCKILEVDTIEELLTKNVKSNYKNSGERDTFVDLILKSGLLSNYEVELITQKGKIIHVLLNSFINGEVITGMMMDITERKQSEKLLHDIIDKNPISIQIVDKKGLTIKINPAHTKLFGTVPPPNFSIFDDLQSKSPTLEKLILLVKKGEVVQLPDLYYNTHDISSDFPNFPVWIRALIFPIKDNYGNPDRFVFMHENITARKHAEDLIKSSEERYQTFINSTDDITFLKDENLRYQIINQATIAFFGKDKEEIIGSTDFELMDEKSANYCLDTDKKVIRDNKLSINEELVKGRTYETHKFPVKMTNGLMGIGGIVRDITDRKKVEEILRESLISLDDAQEIAKMGSWEFDVITQKQKWSKNCFRLFNLKPFEIDPTFEYFKSRIHNDDLQLIDDGIKYLLKNKTSIVLEMRIMLEDGTYKWLQNNIVPIFQDDKLVKLKGTNIDITIRKLAEEALKTSENRYSDLVSNMLDGVYQSTPEGKFLSVNDAMVKMFGYQSKEEMLLLDIKHDMYINPEDRGNVYPKSKAGIRTELCLKKKDGSLIWLSDSGTYIKDVEGKIIRHEGILRDITERKLAEEALRASELRYRALFKTSPSGITVLDENGIILEANEAFAKMTLFSIEELLGSDIRLLTTVETTNIVHENIRRIIDGETLEQEVLSRRKDGSYRVFLLRENLITLPDGGRGILSVHNDITDRKQAEEALRESEEWNKAILHTILSGVTVIDVDTRKIIEVNDIALKLIGLPREQVVGSICHKFICPAEENKCPILDLGKTVDLSEKKLLTVDGLQKDIIKSVVPIQFRGHKYLIESFVDITELKNSQEENKIKNEELLKINSEKDKFFAIIAHDLRSPFNSFLALTQIMSEELPNLSSIEIQKFADSMRKSATNLFRLLENLLEWSRIQQGLIPFTPEIVQLLPIVEESMEMIIEAAKNKDVKVALNIPVELKVFADSNILQTVIRNLASNAVKFTPRGGRVLISAKSTYENSVEIAISDSGIGIGQEMIDNLFRIDINTSRKGTEGEVSTGLGLIICKDFIEKHDGKLSVRSEEGKGSTFYFSIPNEAKVDEKGFIQKVELSEGIKLKKINILIADDDQVSVMLLSMALKGFSNEVWVARNGLEAVEMCRNNLDINVVLMDIQMPEMDGYQATKEIRLFNSDIIIIAQTAYAFSEENENAISLGCNDYIAKPFKDDELKQKINKLMMTN